MLALLIPHTSIRLFTKNPSDIGNVTVMIILKLVIITNNTFSKFHDGYISDAFPHLNFVSLRRLLSEQDDFQKYTFALNALPVLVGKVRKACQSIRLLRSYSSN